MDLPTLFRKALGKLRRRWIEPRTPPRDSYDDRAWNHPAVEPCFLTRFRDYSLETIAFALEHDNAASEPLNAAFVHNVAQTAYKWARLTQSAGHRATVYLHAWDERALTMPEWEEFDGEWPALLDGESFRTAFPNLRPVVPCVTPELTTDNPYQHAWKSAKEGDRHPLFRLQAEHPDLRFETLKAFDGLYGYLLPWAAMLQKHDVSLGAYFPAPSYLSGRPYCSFAIGDDFQTDCGLASDLGLLIATSFHAARFLFVSNPHAIGHCRRLGFRNPVLLSYPMDDSRYAPGEPIARKAWEARAGEGVYVLSTARIDSKVKGNGNLLQTLIETAKRAPSLRFVFLMWGADADRLAAHVKEANMSDRFLLLPPVGKARLIDYYRSCDIVLDQLVYGYFGATGLEAMSVGKPLLIRVRNEHYSPWYGGDLPPVFHCETTDDVGRQLEVLAGNAELRRDAGAKARAWLQRHHGETIGLPRMLALLRLTKDRVPLPADLRSPLLDEETAAEKAYREKCLRPR
ncbi:MAG: glycosyltransferase [Gemmataceae bacterium]|nr:glycosyltransferase [Gemmataceae bacterium]